MSALRSLGNFAGGAAQGFYAGQGMQRANAEEQRKQVLFDAHQSAYKKFGDLIDQYMKDGGGGTQVAPGVTGPLPGAMPPNPSFTGAAQADMQQPADSFTRSARALDMALAPTVQPMVTDMAKTAPRPGRKLAPMPYAQDAPDYGD